MRTILEIDDDVLRRVEEIAESRGTTPGSILSDLARRALRSLKKAEIKNGVPLLTPRPGAESVTPRTVGQLLDEEL